MYYWCALVVVLPALVFAQAPSSPADAPVRIGPGVTAPRLVHKVEPEYSSVARADHVQGTVMLQLFVDEMGRATNVTILSPLGFGLDEKAQAAVEKWRFVPGTKEGKPVRVLATVEVNFRFPDIWFDEKSERQRTTFNVELQTLSRQDAGEKAIDRAVKSMQDLSREKYPPAMYMVGLWETNGDHGTKDPNAGFALIQNAAAKNYGPAIYHVAFHRINGQDLPKDVQEGLEEMHQAATLGSPQAQFYLGNRYENGDGVPRDIERARRYFRLCAAKGIGLCQYRLGTLLFKKPDRSESDYVQALAWFELAAGEGIRDAKDILSKEVAGLTPAQKNWVNTLRTQLVRKQVQ